MILKTSKIYHQEKVITYLYKFELLNEEIRLPKISAHFDKKFLKELKYIKQNYENIIIKIKSNLKDWNWTRLDPLIRSILIYGTYELSFNNKGKVINGMIMFTKGYILNDKHKFVNGIL